MRDPAAQAPTPDPAAGTRAGRLRRRCVLAVPPVLAAAVLLVVFASVRGELPDRLATHVGEDGRADGFTGRDTFALAALLSLFGLGSLFTATARFTSGLRQATAAPRLLLAIGAGTIALIGYLTVMILLANSGAADPATVHFSDWQLAAAGATGAAAGALAWFAAGPDPVTADPDIPTGGGDLLPLRPGERIVWTRTVTAPGVWAAGGITVAGLTALGAFAGWWLLALAIPLGLVFAATGRVRVTADARGLTVTPAGLRAPRVHVPLAEISSAATRPVSAVRDFGGWGYRARAGASGVILRSGDALAVSRASGGTFLVTVDDARTAAATLNTLADRSHHTGP
ncbi:hypothetical protein [Streptomyces qinzhouensis]|uniref:DUF1648 domain-containing protein n=1 Tax=Streptomyces qinzhouensis TaxID=2599401 RepID=A0A5B8IFE4_9ACTN|nr:hypothetical protein [Streptomyces qinzhouensis]QDY77318.1 hypothetical protein FQU76_13215 [Streptomyces qinzhouensis]